MPIYRQSILRPYIPNPLMARSTSLPYSNEPGELMDTLTMALTGQFIADKRMEEFRKLARDQYDCGNKMVSKWCKASRQAMKREVSITEWKGWERLDGFMDWWNEEFPEFGGVTIADLRCAEHEFWSGIV